MATVSLQAVYDQARRLLEGSDNERAIAVAQHILAYFPRNLEAQRILGEAHLASRQPEQAQSSFQTVIHADPENIPAYVGLGISHERQGRTDQAIGAFEHALEIKPDMPELRSQLLRLYTDTWGSESAQLRLSRAGLARLYAKGHMLPQAVQEFRSVIAEQPDRYDARVGLAEVLWRNGQDDAAITVCEDILAEHPDTLKANLLLGYLLLNIGDPRGKQYWDAAAAIDPYQTVAHALFDQLPDNATDEPTLPSWDEQRWLTERADQERAAREHEQIQPSAAAPAAEVAASAPAEPVVASASLDDELFGASWMSAINTPAAPAAQSETVPATPENDDFLASLLSFDDDSSQAESGVAPFSLDDIAASSSAEAPTMPAPEAPPVADDEPVLTPFSLSDLGLSDDEIAGLDSLGDEPSTPEAPAAAAPAAEDAPTLTPFSLSDLGLSDDEIAGLDSLGDEPAPAQAPPPQAEAAVDESATDLALTPFSLSDLGLSDDEIAGLDSLGDEPSTPEAPAAAAPAAEDAPTLTPFSLSDLGLSDDELAGLDSLGDEPAPAQAPPPQAEAAVDESATDLALTPFSLSDLGLSDDEIAGLNATQAPEADSDTDDTLGDMQPFSLEDMLGNPTAEASAIDDDGLPEELQPFSLDDLDINAGNGNSFDLGSLPSSLQPFSLEDMGDAPTRPPRAQTPLSVPEEEEPAGEPAGYSWQQPTSKPTTDFLRDAARPEQPAGQSIFAKLRQRHSELPQVEEPPLPPVADDETDMSLFSHDDISLRDDTEVAQITAQPVASEPVTPPVPPVQTSPASPEALAAATPTASDEPDMTPFSLSDLGLSPEEIAVLGIEDVGVVAETSALDAPAAEPAAAPAASDEPDMTPFSLNDLGLSDDEIAAFGIDEGASGTQSTTANAETDPFEGGDFQPFSLDDLGLDDAASFNADLPPNELGLTDDELAGMDLGPLSNAASTQANTNVDTGDPALDRLITLGQRQGFVDLTDIIAAVRDPEEEPERIEEIGQVLHRAGIEIRDGDEVVDMDEEVDAIEPFDETADLSVADATTAPPASVSSGEPDMTPFSLSDLGLSPEEIAALGLEEAAEEPPVAAVPVASDEPPAASGEPDMTPFSLSDLGLSPEEIAALGLEEPAAPAAAEEPPVAAVPAATPATADEPPAASGEPDMTPFSLSDLGLSPEEIAALGLEEPAAPAAAEEAPVADAPAATPATTDEPPAASGEPDMTPFSLSDLGLSPEEIAALGLEEAATDVSAPAEEAPVAAAPAATPATADEPPAASGEPDMTPFSLSDFGLSPEEIAAFELEQASSPEAATQSPPTANGEPDMTPFSLNDLGLTAEEIDALDLPNVEPAPAASVIEEADEFDFNAVEAQLGQSGPVRAQPGQPRPPREEEPPPPAPPEDLAFTPEPLDALDSIWAALPVAEPVAKAAPPAKAPEQAPTRATTARTSTIERLPARGESSRSTRDPSPPRAEPTRREPSRSTRDPSPPRAEPTRREPNRTVAPSAERPALSWKARQQTSFIPTGDEQLDELLRQLEAEPNNDHLRLAIARVGGKSSRIDLAVYQYKTLIREGTNLDDVVDDLQELIDENEEARDLQRFYRLLGDAYSKQNRYRDAVEAYSWTFGK